MAALMNLDSRAEHAEAQGTTLDGAIPAPSVYGATQFGYVVIDSPRLADWRRFAAEGIGMALAEESDSRLAFRIDAHARRLVVRKSTADDVTLGWQVAGDANLDIVLARLNARGIAVEEASGEQASLRGVDRFWRFVGPKRQAIELFTEPELATEPPKPLGSGFITGPNGLGHVAITTTKPDAMIAFWRDVFDAKISDFIEDRINGVNLRFTFLRMNPRHHSIAVAATKGVAMDPFATKIQHLELQVGSLADVVEAYRRCRTLGFKIAMSIGQHTNDHLVSFYAVTPSGFHFELGWDDAGGTEGEQWPQVTHQGISLWGHKPQDLSLHDRLSQVRNALTSLLRDEFTPG